VQPTPLHRHAFIDIETTGLEPSSDEVIELGLVLVNQGAARSSHRWRFGHQKPLSPMIQALTGLPERAPEGTPTLAQEWPRIAPLLEGHTVVAHNASFERSFLGELHDRPMLDSCELTHLLFPAMRSHSLDSLVRWANVGTGARHRALDDAEDTFQVVRVAIERASANNELGEQIPGPLGELLRALRPRTDEPVRPEPVEGATPRAPSPRGLTLNGVAALETEQPADHFASLCRDFTAAGIDVAVPTFRLGDVPDDVPRRLPVSSRVCRERLLKLLELPRFTATARGYVRRWLDETRHGERATLSGWMSERWPDVRLLGLLSLADADCRCFESSAQSGAVITHETALASLSAEKPHVILDAARLSPRPAAVEGRRLRELRALYELADVPFEEATAPTAEQVRALRAPLNSEAALVTGLARAIEYFAGLLTPAEPIDVAVRLRASATLLVHDVVTAEAKWLSTLGLGDLAPERRPLITRSVIERVTEVPAVLRGVALGMGTITPDFVASQVALAPGQVRLGLASSAALRLASWWPGQSLASLDVDQVTLLGPARNDDLRRLQLALPACVQRIVLIDPPPPVESAS